MGTGGVHRGILTKPIDPQTSFLVLVSRRAIFFFFVLYALSLAELCVFRSENILQPYNRQPVGRRIREFSIRSSGAAKPCENSWSGRDGRANGLRLRGRRPEAVSPGRSRDDYRRRPTRPGENSSRDGR